MEPSTVMGIYCSRVSVGSRGSSLIAFTGDLRPPPHAPLEVTPARAYLAEISRIAFIEVCVLVMAWMARRRSLRECWYLLLLVGTSRAKPMPRVR